MLAEITLLVLALSGPAVLLALLRRFEVDTLSWAARLALWVLASVVLFLILQQEGSLAGAVRRTGLSSPAFASLVWGAGGAFVLCVAMGLATLAQRVAGLPVGDREMFARIAELPASRRILIVLTAGIVEEFLFRGVGIGVGAVVLGDGVVAGVISTIAFTISHFRWRPYHLVQVALAGAVFASLFLATGGDLWTCIVAHLLIDGIGFILVPYVMRWRERSDQPKQKPSHR